MPTIGPITAPAIQALLSDELGVCVGVSDAAPMEGVVLLEEDEGFGVAPVLSVRIL